MNREKRLLKEQKKKQKKHKKRVKELRNILDWMHVQKVDHYGIYLQSGKKEMIVRGLELSSNNIFLKEKQECARDIYSFASGLDYLRGETYFKFVKTPLKLSRNVNRLSEMLEMEKNPGIRKILKLQIDKMEIAMSKFQEMSFYVLVQDSEDVIDKRLLKVREACQAAGLAPREMGITDYEAVLSQQFENDTVNEYMYSALVVDEEVYENADIEIRKGKKNDNSTKGND